MVILTLVATTAAGMVWQQQRAVQVEAAERSRAQAGAVLEGALDFARAILRLDSLGRLGPGISNVDHLGESWAVPLAEARLSTFLAADGDPTVDDGPQAFLSGRISDLQSRYNVANLIDDENKVLPAELAVLRRLCELAGVPTDVGARIGRGLSDDDDGTPGDAPLAPQRFEQLAWLGLDGPTLDRLAPFVTLLPARTPVNVNTAPREVIAAAVEGLDLGSAERLVQRRQRQPYRNVEELRQELPKDLAVDRLAVESRFFEVVGRLRLDDRVVEQRSLVERRGAARGGEVVALWRERRAVTASTP
jgi:general secretion pathway protein K